MNDINQREGVYVLVPRELYAAFSKSRSVMAFFETLAAKVDGSSASLSDVEQRSGIPALSRSYEQGKEIADIVRGAVSPLKGRIMELEKEVEELRRAIRPPANLNPVYQQLDDIEKSYRPRC